MVTIIRKIKVGIHPEHSNYVEPILKQFHIIYTSHFYSTKFVDHDIYQRFYEGTIHEDQLNGLISELDTLPISVTLQY